MFGYRPDNFPNDYRPDWDQQPPQKPDPGRIWLRILVILALVGLAWFLLTRR